MELVLSSPYRSRLGNAGMRFEIEAGHQRDRIGHQFGGCDLLVGDAVDEAGIRAVLQQASHQIRQQFLVRTHGCVDAAGNRQRVRPDHLVVKILAHAVQALVLVRLAAGVGVDRGDGLRVVGGEHRIERVGRAQHLLRAGQIDFKRVGVGFAREHRIAGHAIDLGALHFQIPVRALHQAHRHAATVAARQIGEEVEHEGQRLW